MKKIFEKHQLRVVSRRKSSRGTKIWFHLNDLRFVDLDKLEEDLKNAGFSLISEDDMGFNEFLLTQDYTVNDKE